jgi:hypothetical protein
MRTKVAHGTAESRQKPTLRAICTELVQYLN